MKVEGKMFEQDARMYIVTPTVVRIDFKFGTPDDANKFFKKLADEHFLKMT